MSTRVKTALVAGILFLGVLLAGGRLLFAVLVAAASVVGVREYLGLVTSGSEEEESGWVSVWGGVIALSFLGGEGALPGLALAAGTIGYFAGWVLGSGPREDTLQRWGRVAGAWILVAYFLGHAVWIREHGILPVLFPLFIVWAGDTAAFYVGSAVGRRRLAPAVSPNKSVEGAVASVVAAGGVALLAAVFLPLPHGPTVSVLLGLGLNGAAQMGDLMESLIKRCTGTKDSGTLFPGHGGLLDRIDALLPVLPLYAGYLAFWGG